MRIWKRIVAMILLVTLFGMPMLYVTRALTGFVRESGSSAMLIGAAVFMLTALISSRLIGTVRELMMERIQQVLCDALPGIEFEPMINIAHNYATREHHFGHDVIVHRKGATLARQGVVGIIPGSQGTASYIVEGLGNPDSFCSCSHGAGRVMSRTAAIRDLDLHEEVERLDALGIVHAIRTQDDMQEASGAYKDIDTVIANEADLVRPLVRLLPVAVIKG